MSPATGRPRTEKVPDPSTMTRYRPSGPDVVRATSRPVESSTTMTAPVTGRGAQPGCGGFRSTGQVGPAVTKPTIARGGPPDSAVGAGEQAATKAAVTTAARSAARRTGRRADPIGAGGRAGGRADPIGAGGRAGGPGGMPERRAGGAVGSRVNATLTAWSDVTAAESGGADVPAAGATSAEWGSAATVAFGAAVFAAAVFRCCRVPVLLHARRAISACRRHFGAMARAACDIGLPATFRRYGTPGEPYVGQRDRMPRLSAAGRPFPARARRRDGPAGIRGPLQTP